MGIGDPLAPENDEAHVWATGEEERAIVTAARPVRLAEGRVGILIDQMAGFEHPKRRHDLFAAIDGRVVSIWSYVEPQGPYWSTVIVRPATNATGDGLLLVIAFSPDPKTVDVLATEQLELSASRRMMEVVQAPSMVELAVAGPFAGVAIARRLKEQYPDCLDGFWVLDSDAAGVKDVHGVVLAAVTTRRDVAERALERVSTCVPPATVRQVQSAAIQR